MTQLACLHLLVANEASDLEQYAAQELKAILERLYLVNAHIVAHMSTDAAATIVIGRPETHKVLSHMVGGNWPTMSDQGLLLRWIEGQQPIFLIGGGSDVATLWAVYELGERLGVRYLHHRDVYPEQQVWPGLPRLDIVMEPTMPIRCWRLVNEHACGPLSWSLHENQRFLQQMAKMKFNGVRVQLWPAQPFVHYTIGGMAKPKGVIFFGQTLPIHDETIGLEKLRPNYISEFTNPEFVGAETAEELHSRAVHLVRGILDEARRLGMQTALAFDPVEWPKAFEKVLPQSVLVEQCGHLTIGPGPNQSMDDPLLRDATATVIKAYVETYPQVDNLIFSMPEHGHWIGNAEAAFEKLVDVYDLVDIESFDALCDRARSRTDFPGGGERVERQMKNDLSSLWFLDSILREFKLLSRPGGGPDIRVVYSNVTQELFSIVEQIAPPGGEIVSLLDYTASRQLQRRELLQRRTRPRVPASLIFTLADDNIGLLPQLATGSLRELMSILRKHGWSGFHTRYWTIGDLDPTIHFLARGSWNATITSQEAYADQVSHVCGPNAVAPALKAFAIIEEITLRLDQHGMGVAFPVPSMMIQHFEAGELWNDVLKDRDEYLKALGFMKQAFEDCKPDGREYIAYFVGRLRFAVDYLNAADSFSAAGRVLREGGSPTKVLEHLDRADGAIRKAVQEYVEVAHDHSDLGAIVTLNEYCCQPICDKREEIKALGAVR